MVDYYRALAAILMMEIQQTAPAHRYEPEPESATRATQARGEACTVRDRVEDYIRETSHDYYGRGYRDTHINAPELADVLGCSTETARRRLKYFEEQGIVEWDMEGKCKHYKVCEEYSPSTDEDKVRSAAQIVDAAKEAIEAAEED